MYTHTSPAPASPLSVSGKWVSCQHYGQFFFLCFLTKHSFWELPALCLQSQGPGRLVPLGSMESAPRAPFQAYVCLPQGHLGTPQTPPKKGSLVTKGQGLWPQEQHQVGPQESPIIR